MPLTGETSGGEAGRSISSASRYMTTTSLISISRCSASHSRVPKVARRCCATSSGEVMRPDGVRTFPSVMSLVTFVLAMAPRPSHGPLPCPGQPYSTHTILTSSRNLLGCSDQKLRFSLDLKWVALSVSLSHAQNFSFSS